MAISGAKETYTKISSLVESQFPEFIREEGPRFVAFLEAYFEYLEKADNAGSEIRKLKDNQDIDRTVDEFIEYFRREFMVNIPTTVLADKRLLVKHIRDFYRTRGSQKSFKFLFRILFNEEVEFYYPGQDILRTSDGRWIKETIIRVGAPFIGDPNDFDGRVVTGSTSGAKGRVQLVQVTTFNGLTNYNLVVENAAGTFQDFEIITDGFGTEAHVLSEQGGIVQYYISDGGAFNEKDDELRLIGDLSGDTARARVLSIQDSTDKLTFKIINSGSGYRVGTPSKVTITGGTTEETAAFVVSSISNTQYVTINTDIIGYVKNVRLNTGSTFQSLGTNTHSLNLKLRTSNVSSTLTNALTFANAQVGSINAISITNPGAGYSAPYNNVTITVEDSDVYVQRILDGRNPGPPSQYNYKGRNALIIANSAPGAIASIELLQRGSNFIRGEKVNILNDEITINSVTNQNSNNQIRYVKNSRYASGNLVPTGVTGITTLPGRYVGSRGFLSWNNKLQDNNYYQEYSYVIKSKQLLSDYRDIIKKVLHVAGTKMFGIYEVTSAISVQPIVISTITNQIAGLDREIVTSTADKPTAVSTRIASPREAITTSLDTTAAFVSKNVNQLEVVSTSTDTTTAISTRVATPLEAVTATAETSTAVYTGTGTNAEAVTTNIESVVGAASRIAAEAEAVTTNDDLVVGAASRIAAEAEAITTNDDLVVGAASRIAAEAEAITTNDDLQTAISTRLAAGAEAVTTVDNYQTAISTRIATPIESSFANDAPTAISTRLAAGAEAVTTNDDLVVGGAIRPAVVTTENFDNTADSTNAFITKEVTVREVGSTTMLDTTTPELYKFTNYVRVVYANTGISTFSTDTINLLRTLTIQNFSNIPAGPKLVIATPPYQATATFGDGNIRANTGSISVGGSGSRIYVIPNGATSPTQLSVNTVYSNTVLTTRASTATTANARFFYSTTYP